MENDITKKIDTLVEMAESALNIDTAKAELNEIENQKIFLKTELDLLKEEGKKDKYFKASEKQVDENIKVSLEAKIKKQEKSIQVLQQQIDDVVGVEVSIHNELTKLQDNIASSKEYIAILNDRFSAINDEENREYYQKLLQDENEKLDGLVSFLHQKEEEHNEVLEQLNYLNLAMEEMQGKLANEKDRLVETKANLVNPISYIDQDLKQIDEDRVMEIERELSSLDRRRIEILTDPVMIADDAKELIEMNDYENALQKIQELVTIAKSKPFMDVPNGSELAAMLKEEEDSAIDARDQFATFIDSKNYMDQDNQVIEERINYLNIEIASYENKIKLAKEEIKNIDTVEIQELNSRLEDTLAVQQELEDDLENYKIIMESEQEDKTPKRRAILAAAFSTKQKELSNVLNLVSHYKNDQKVLIQQAYTLEAHDIAMYESEIRLRQEEISEMGALLKNTNKVKDVLAIENDKKKLKELDEAVKDIKHRQKYNQTPSEIYDEIEIYLGGMDSDSTYMVATNSMEDGIHFEEDLNFESLESPEMNEENNIDSEIMEDVFVDDEDIAKFTYDGDEDPFIEEASFVFDDASIETQEVLTELPELSLGELVGNRMKVVQVEPMDNNDNSFVIGSYDEVSNGEV